MKNIFASRPGSLLLSATVGLALLSACNRGPQGPSLAEQEKQALANVSEQDTKQAANPDETSKALPADYPKDIEVFPGAAVEHVRKPKGSMREIFLSATGSLDELIKFYKDHLQQNGYDLTSSLRMAARKTWSCDFHKGAQQCSVMVFPMDQDKTKLTIDIIYQMPATVASGPAQAQETFDVIGPGPVGQQASAGNVTTQNKPTNGKRN